MTGSEAAAEDILQDCFVSLMRHPGVHFRYETRVEPEIAGQKFSGFGGGGLVVAERFHRFMEDAANKRYFGYDLDAEPLAGGRVRVTFHPLSLTAEKLELKPAGAWTQIRTPALPGEQTVSGEALAVELFVHPVTGQKIVDYLFFQDRKPADEWGGGGMSGEAVYFYLPGLGRYVMSLAPNAGLGFRKLGEVRGDSLTIRTGSETIDIECEGPIAPGGGAFNLYVYHDAAWRPRDSSTGFTWGASQARNLVGQPGRRP